MYQSTVQTGVVVAPSFARDQGILAGTRIRTATGECPVETLRAGDVIVTRDSGLVVLEGIERSLSPVDGVRIVAGAEGEGVPEHPVTMPADARIFLRGARAMELGMTSMLITARDLVDGVFVQAVTLKDVEMFTLIFERRHIIYASGLECLAGQER